MADLSHLKGLDPETFAACMRITELATFLTMHPEHVFQPGQYPYVEHPPEPLFSKEGKGRLDNPPQSPFKKGGGEDQEALLCLRK